MSHKFWRFGAIFSRNFPIIGRRCLITGAYVAGLSGLSVGVSGTYAPNETNEEYTSYDESKKHNQSNNRGGFNIGGDAKGSIVSGDYSHGDEHHIYNNYNYNYAVNPAEPSSYLSAVNEMDNTMPQKCALIYGRSQAGKSTFINNFLCLTGNDRAKTGTGDGGSCTNHFQDINGNTNMYKKLCKYNLAVGIQDDFVLNIMDTPGFGDSDLRWTDRAILEDDILYQLLANGNNVKQIDVIFLAESLKDGVTQIRQNLANIESVFGNNAIKSIVVLGLRSDESDDIRQNGVAEFCDRHNLPYVVYDSMKSHSHNNQFKQVMEKFFDQKVKPFHQHYIETFQNEIEQRALEIQKLSEYTKHWTTETRGKRRYGIAGPHKKTTHHHYETVQKDIEQCRTEAKQERMDKIRASLTSYN